MSHGITSNDSLLSVRARPWHGLGVVLAEPPADLDDALAKSGLVWEVDPQCMYILDDGEPRPIEGHVANVRSEDGAVLGIVSERYRVISNREAFSFLASLIGSELHFETAGSLHGGRRVFVMCQAARLDRGRRRARRPVRRPSPPATTAPAPPRRR